MRKTLAGYKRNYGGMTVLSLKMCPEIYCGPSLRRRGSLRKSSHTSKYAPVFGSPRSLQPGLLATISGHIFTRG